MTKLIAPGPTITGLNRKFFEDHPEDLKARIQSIPIGRMGQPQDHVGAALLLSPSLADLGVSIRSKADLYARLACRPK